MNCGNGSNTKEDQRVIGERKGNERRTGEKKNL